MDSWETSKEYKAVVRNQKRFEKMLLKLEKEPDEIKRISRAKNAASFAVINSTGYFSSNKLEKIFTDCAKSHDIDDYNIKYTKDSFLHVMTQAYTGGGHTRVVERWITLSPETQKHSIVLLNQQDVPYPKDYFKTITSSKSGSVHIFENNNSLLEKALELRKLALSYEYIVLHIHMDDPTALIAFGTEKFTRPVIFYNHADHLFWIGKCVSDIIADLRTYTSITKTHRGINSPFLLGVPSDKKDESSVKCFRSTTDIKKELQIPQEAKILFTSGSCFKYTPYLNQSLSDILVEYVNSHDNIYCLVVGPNDNEKQWNKARKKTDGKIKAIGPIPYHEGYLDYLNSADVVIDSWPMGGGTALIDAVSLEKPVLSLKSPLGQFDYIITSSSYCQNRIELIKKIDKVLTNNDYANKLAKEILEKYSLDHSPVSWTKKLDQLIKNIPEKHFVKNLSDETDYSQIDELSLENYTLYHPKGITKIYSQINKAGIPLHKYIEILRLNFPKTYLFLRKLV